MPELYPLLLEPYFSERVWGARDLSPFYSQQFEKPIGESWLTADHCRVRNGPLAGKTLGELCERYGNDLIGSAAPQPGRFPLLVKFLFPHEKLSVQVHPDDAGARRVGEPNGKTECWYVLAAEPGAQVALGLKPGVTKEQLRRAIDELTVEDLLQWVDVRPGDMIYVEAGTVHAIGPGSVLVETQQNSDTTYRLYDYGRPRELHLNNGMEAVKERTAAGKVAPRVTANQHVNLITVPPFAVDKFKFDGPRHFGAEHSGNSAQIFVALDGCGVVSSPGTADVTFARGEAVVIPAGLREFTIRPQWSLECLRSYVPAAVGATMAP